MPLLNYTTKIEVENTIGEIQSLLSKSGAMKTMVDYDDGIISALSFALRVNDQVIGFRLPCDWRPVQAVLARQKERNSRVNTDKVQAVRVAWRIILNWVEAQCALIETQMVRTEEVFLPYMMVGPDKTLYQKMANEQFLLGDGK